MEIRPKPGFLQGSLGPLFILCYPPAQAVPPRGSILYIYPFAEEMDKSRRMAALQARRFTATDFSVLQPDTYGCGAVVAILPLPAGRSGRPTYGSVRVGCWPAGAMARADVVVDARTVVGEPF